MVFQARVRLPQAVRADAGHVPERKWLRYSDVAVALFAAFLRRAPVSSLTKMLA